MRRVAQIIVTTALMAMSGVLAAKPETPPPSASEWPSVATVERDMKGAGKRDTAARTAVAFEWLALIAGRWGAKATADEYVRVRDRYLTNCRDEPGCDGGKGAGSQFLLCRSKYEASPEFFRVLLDKYIPAEQQEWLTSLGGAWGRALALPPGKGDAVPSPSLVCTTTGQFKEGDDAAAKAKADLAEQRRREKEAEADAETDDERALAEAIRVSTVRDKKAGHGVDMTVFGIVLGEPLVLPECPSLSLLNVSAAVRGGAETCRGDLTADIANAMIRDALPTDSLDWAPTPKSERVSIILARDRCPSWVDSCKASAIIDHDIVLSVTIGTEGGFGADSFKRIGSELEDKYGQLERPESKTCKNRFGVEWSGDVREAFLPRGPGLTRSIHVRYDPLWTCGSGQILVETMTSYELAKAAKARHLRNRPKM